MGAAGRKLRNLIFIALIVVTNTLGNLFLALSMSGMANFQPDEALEYARDILTNFWFLGGVALLVLWMIAQLSMYTWADLSYVLPVTASAYAFTAILGKFFLGERISIAHWTGIVLISFGVLLVSETPPWTHSFPPPEEDQQ
jgi:drug/metabolite transporter (DMT)-like permease